MPAFEKRIDRACNRIGIVDRLNALIESAGKRFSAKNTKNGNAHLKWAFSEAACLFVRGNSSAKDWHQKLISKYGKAKSLSIIAQRLGRTAYTILKRRAAFDRVKFFESLQ